MSTSASTMKGLVEEHLAREAAGDSAGAVAVYTEDVEHDVVGSPMGVLAGPAAAQVFYDHLISDLKIDDMRCVREWYGEDFTVMEHAVAATVVGTFMGIPGHGKSVQFRMLHVWDFQGDKISRENVWLDGAAIAGQLTGS
ncbi:MAG: ester cyclase [Actinomycetota bacterium]|nr:ester cyclase [Actinomycetota bacterium]